MRLTCLLYMGLALFITSCGSSGPLHLPRLHPYDTLRKYSYLLVMIGPDSAKKNLPPGPRSNGTGFFYRKNDSIFLVTAFHVLSGCHVYGKGGRDVLWFMDVWYRDKEGKRLCVRVPLPPRETDTCQLANVRPDVVKLNVTSLFRDIPIHSIEDLIKNDTTGTDTLAARERVVCYNYSNVDSVMPAYARQYLPRRAARDFGRGIGYPDNEVDLGMQTYYYFICPRRSVGASGAPVFRIKRDSSGKKKADFIGVQSGSRDSTGNYSTIVKKGTMLNMFP